MGAFVLSSLFGNVYMQHPEVCVMNGLIGDSDVDLLILPIVTTTLVFGQALQVCVNWISRYTRLNVGRVAA